jgi:hypothetical protein
VKRGGVSLETQALLERASAAQRLLARDRSELDPGLLLSYVCWPTDELLEAQERRRKAGWQRKLERDPELAAFVEILRAAPHEP